MSLSSIRLILFSSARYFNPSSKTSHPFDFLCLTSRIKFLLPSCPLIPFPAVWIRLSYDVLRGGVGPLYRPVPGRDQQHASRPALIHRYGLPSSLSLLLSCYPQTALLDFLHPPPHDNLGQQTDVDLLDASVWFKIDLRLPHTLPVRLSSLLPSPPLTAAQCVVVAFSSSPTWIFVSLVFSMLANLVYPSMSSLVSKV